MNAAAAAAWEGARADGFDEYKRLVLDAGPAAAAALTRAEAVLDAAARAEPGAWRAKHGRVLAALGRAAEARAALDGAAGDADAPRWLGALLLAQGDAAAAEAALAKAPAADAWAAALRGAARLARGLPADAELAAVASSKGEAARFAALVRALHLARSGDADAARRALDAEAAAAPSSAWPLAVRARLHALAGDTGARLRDLDEAVRREPAAWVRDERSRAFEELGDMDRALAEADAAVAASPDADRHLRRAHVQVCRRHYHLAEPDFLAAARLEPARAEAWLGAASVALTRGRPDQARDLAGQAARRAPGDVWAALEAARYSVFAGDGKRAAKTAAALERRHRDFAFPARMVRALAALKARDYKAAAKLFASAEAAAPGPEFARKAAFHRVLALGLSLRGRGSRRAKKGERRLLIGGLGARAPYSSTVGVLRLAAACDFAYNNLSEPENAALIAALAPDFEPTMFDVRGADRRWTRTIFRNVRPGRTVGFITRGHPQVCGGLAGSLMEECGRTGATWDLLPAVSSMDNLAMDAVPGAALWGQQVIDWSTVFDERFAVETRLPLVVYYNAAAQLVKREEYLRFCAKLEALYGPEHAVWFYGRTFLAAPERVPLKSARAWHGKIDPSYTLVIPPKAA